MHWRAAVRCPAFTDRGDASAHLLVDRQSAQSCYALDFGKSQEPGGRAPYRVRNRRYWVGAREECERLFQETSRLQGSLSGMVNGDACARLVVGLASHLT
jgi:hypothetical protein